jgi:hypothetical protein
MLDSGEMMMFLETANGEVFASHTLSSEEYNQDQ